MLGQTLHGVLHTSGKHYYPRHLLKSNAFNLDRDTLGKLMNCDAAASRLVGEEFLVLGIHFSEVGHVYQKDLLYSGQPQLADSTPISCLWAGKPPGDRNFGGWIERTLTLTIFATDEPAAAKTAPTLSQH